MARLLFPSPIVANAASHLGNDVSRYIESTATQTGHSEKRKDGMTGLLEGALLLEFRKEGF